MAAGRKILILVNERRDYIGWLHWTAGTNVNVTHFGVGLQEYET
jgi:hypothetical protein